MTRTDPARERGERIEELLNTLEGIPVARHEDYLAQVCPDLELRREVLSLLSAEREAHSYLEWFTDGLLPLALSRRVLPGVAGDQGSDDPLRHQDRRPGTLWTAPDHAHCRGSVRQGLRPRHQNPGLTHKSRQRS